MGAAVPFQPQMGISPWRVQRLGADLVGGPLEGRFVLTARQLIC